MSGWVTETVRFEEVKHHATKNLPCPRCGKKVRRQRTFTNTINPWNRDPATGLPRTRQEIREKLREEGAAWELEPVPCSRCETGNEAVA
jgi:uncharacterized C2H2 Zn-finger protein